MVVIKGNRAKRGVGKKERTEIRREGDHGFGKHYDGETK